ncbi:DUF3244 domain-containing protein [Bacteroides fragilis]|uniref:DUF3244 domain-containing protein n=1 Tax=Bacteroides TaxID=816 RepID=UPI0018790B5F|nr:DUF3244 domain-containing protein [Bacteroides fragilis]MBE7398078.1 DUF3244 domain-containing protein [Bacteroides fragilis]MCM0383864.1 DUF3244 domain-containing protein [Bacteroides fragilis]
MKVRKDVLFTGLILLQLLALPGEVYGMEHAVMAVMKKKHNVHTNTHFSEENRRDILPVACGYIEDNQLFLSFSSPLNNMKIQIVDSETGQTVFDDTITGTSFSILLERDFDSFDIYISNIDN